MASSGAQQAESKNNARPGRKKEANLPLRACPYLGIADDPATHFAFPNPANRCFCPASPGKGAHAAVDLQHQQSYCLSPRYSACTIYQKAENVVATPPVVPATAAKPATRRSGAPLFEPGRSLKVLSKKPASRRLLLGALLIMLIALQLLMGQDTPARNDATPDWLDAPGPSVAVESFITLETPAFAGASMATPTATRTPLAASPTSRAASPAAGAKPPPVASATTIASPTAVASPAATTTPTATAAPTEEAASPTATATATACGPPAGWVTTVVQPGENLFRIALRHNSSVAALMQANCLPSPAIYTGQLLFVPFHAPPSTATPTPAATATTIPTNEPPPPPPTEPPPPPPTAPPSATAPVLPTETPPPTSTTLPPTSTSLPPSATPAPTQDLPTATPPPATGAAVQ